MEGKELRVIIKAIRRRGKAGVSFYSKNQRIKKEMCVLFHHIVLLSLFAFAGTCFTRPQTAKKEPQRKQKPCSLVAYF